MPVRRPVAALLVALVVSGALAGCASTYRQRISSRLYDMGLSRGMSNCMADHLVDRLSTRQLRSLADLGKGVTRDPGDLTIRQLMERFRGLGDPELTGTVTRAGLACAIAG